MYKDYKIKGVRKTWVSWLAEFAIGESRVSDVAYRSKIAVSIANNFHKKGLARFTTAKDKTYPDVLIVTRVE